MLKPAIYNILDYLTSGKVITFDWKTTDISLNTYEATARNREDGSKLFDFIVVQTATTVTIKTTAAMKVGLEAGNYFWDLIEKTSANPDGMPIIAGDYNLQISATQ